MVAGIEAFAGYVLGPMGALAYAIWHNHKGDRRDEIKDKKLEAAMDKNVAIVREIAEAHKSTAEVIKKELDQCHDNYHRLQTKVDTLGEKNGYLTAKVEMLEKRG